MPDQFWYILAGIVFVVANIILWLHLRQCKAKGITAKPAFEGLKKHEKRISKWTDILLITIIILEISLCGYLSIPDLFSDTGAAREISFSLGFMSMFYCSVIVVLQASSLSPFHCNITLKKRLILLIMSCVPIMFWVPLRLHDFTSESRPVYLKLLLSGLFVIFMLNSPAILLGKSFFKFFTKLIRKISLPWFQISEQNDTKGGIIGTET